MSRRAVSARSVEPAAAEATQGTALTMEGQAAVRPDPPFPVRKSSGSTPAERYLERLCEKNFLSLWSYPRPFRDQGGGKELCDLLVVLGNDVIVFSDKHCDLKVTGDDLALQWARWFKKAVSGGARQAWGAERWLREQIDRVFLDPECRHPIPVPLPDPREARYHLVVTVHGVSEACRSVFGGTGSLMLRTDVRGLDAHQQPFVIGDLDPTRTFVHVLDDTTMAIVMSALDTTPDFLRYLKEKERVCRLQSIFAAGEENLLAWYLTHVDETGEHAFNLDSRANLVAFDESGWPAFMESPERRAQKEHDRISYAWDELIGEFAHHALEGTQQFASSPSLGSSETILRFMAGESRLRRRSLADALVGAVQRAPRNGRFLRVVLPQGPDQPLYVMLAFPWRHDRPEDENRMVRRNYLEACLQVAKLRFPDASHIVGLATESGAEVSRRSEDAFYFNAAEWTVEDAERAKQLQRDLGILISEQMFVTSVDEYPVAASSSARVTKVGRNEKCPCGSGRKYKFCHGARAQPQ
jgi:hypothetical protein